MSIQLRIAAALALLFLGLAPLASAGAKVFLSVDEALGLAFPELDVAKRTVYLDTEQQVAVEKLLGEKLPCGIARPYVASDAAGNVVGVAWFDTHRVRSQRETLMFVVDPKGAIQRLEVLAFAEPREYLPRAGWYAQFRGRGLGELRLAGGIKPITGATMSARATVSAARRSLALHQILFPEPAPQPQPQPQPKPQAGSKTRSTDAPQLRPTESKRTQS